jgi:hypothetical protein
MTWYLCNENSAGLPDAAVPFRYGLAGWKPVAGDWNASGHTGVGVLAPDGYWYLRSTTGPGLPDIGPFPYGLGSWAPLAGTWKLPGQLQLAAGGVRGADAGADPLSEAQLQGVVAAALRRLCDAGVAASVVQRLASAHYDVARLPGADLGLTNASSDRVAISADAAGYGWFVDTTPLRDEEFRTAAPGSPLVAGPGSPAAGKMDLLTVVLHEMGHLAGRPDVGASGHSDDLMAEALAPGTRRVDALDQVFARWA